MSEDWKFHRDRQVCTKPGCPLPTSRSYFSVLEWTLADAERAGSCVRRDLCDACFADHERRCAGGEPPIFWRALRKASGSKEPVLDLNSLRALFDRLAGVDDERARALRYFCALLLLRKRLLKIVPARTAEQERADLVVVDPKLQDAEPTALFAPAIDLDALGSLKDDLLAAIGETAEGSAAESS